MAEKYICKTNARIHSLGGETAEVAIIEKVGDNDYIAEFNGVKCHAIFNPFASCYYVDDKYGIVKESECRRNESCR
ncbi:MAG: hypothetical protein RR597_05340 [Christensenella sp.]